jgi:2-phospho-L-lactate transferase/gluconeogenesis factor (CofD/UPF0052 family)
MALRVMRILEQVATMAQRVIPLTDQPVDIMALVAEATLTQTKP